MLQENDDVATPVVVLPEKYSSEDDQPGDEDIGPEYTEAVPSVMKSLSCLAHRKRQSLVNYMVDYSELRLVPGPYVLFARLVVLVAVPFKVGPFFVANVVSYWDSLT